MTLDKDTSQGDRDGPEPAGVKAPGGNLRTEEGSGGAMPNF